jgi:hypothetical protein
MKNMILATVAALGLSANLAGADTVVSHDFDTPGVGSYTTVDGSIYGAGVDATSFPTGNVLYMRGNQQGRSITFAPVDLSSGGKASFSFIIGDYYTTNQNYFEGQDGGYRGGYDEDVSFQYSTNGGVDWTALDVFSSSYANTGTQSVAGWTNFSYTFAANAAFASTTLRFLQPNNDTDCCDHWAIDNLSVVNNAGAVPEPATWALMILGFGAVGGAMRRRQAVAAKVRFA